LVRTSGDSIGMSSAMQRLRSHVILVAVPYVCTKIEKLVERLRDVPPRRMTRLSSLLLAIYPRLKSATMLACLIFQASYAFSFGNQSSPLLWLAGFRLQRLTTQDLRSLPTLPISLRKTGLFPKLYRLLFKVPTFFGRLFSYGLFMFQFLEHFYSSDIPPQFASLKIRGAGRRRNSPPPHPLSRTSKIDAVAKLETRKCPICYKIRVQDTVLSTSGYVFCYRCITEWLRREGRCPITNIPASDGHLVRIFE